MKVVINGCFGGFGLSYAACMRYAQLKGLTLYAFTTGRNASGLLDFGINVPYDGTGDAWCVMYSTVPLDQIDDAHKNSIFWSDRSIERHDATLIAVVEEMGAVANDSHAKLRVVEIPDGTDYTIEEYDGSEHIAEAHRTWS